MCPRGPGRPSACRLLNTNSKPHFQGILVQRLRSAFDKPLCDSVQAHGGREGGDDGSARR